MSLESIIYWADVIGKIQFCFIVLLAVEIFFLIGVLVNSHYKWEESITMYYQEETRKNAAKMHQKLRRSAKYIFLLITFNILLLVFLPSQNTIYMMIGVSASKEALQTPEVQKVIKVINLELDKKIKELDK